MEFIRHIYSKLEIDLCLRFDFTAEQTHRQYHQTFPLESNEVHLSNNLQLQQHIN